MKLKKALLALILFLCFIFMSEAANISTKTFNNNYEFDVSKNCAVYSPSDFSRTIKIKMNSGNTLSNLTIIPRNGHSDDIQYPDDVTVTEIHIGYGIRPLYLIIKGSNVQIIKFTGNIWRIERIFVDETKGTTTGIYGIPSDKIHFENEYVCNSKVLSGIFEKFLNKDRYTFSESIQREFKKTALVMSYITGNYDNVRKNYENKAKMINHGSSLMTKKYANDWDIANATKLNISGIMDYAYSPKSINLGFPYKNNKNDVFPNALNAYPGGIINLNQEKIVTTGIVKENTQYPSLLGIRKLIIEGKIEKTSDPFILKILEPIEFQNSYCRYGFKFILSPGVPMPANETCSKQVIN